MVTPEMFDGDSTFNDYFTHWSASVCYEFCFDSDSIQSRIYEMNTRKNGSFVCLWGMWSMQRLVRHLRLCYLSMKESISMF